MKTKTKPRTRSRAKDRHPAMLVRNIDPDVRKRMLALAAMRQMTLAVYTGKLVALHDALLSRARSDDPEIDANARVLLGTFDLGPVEG